MPALPPASATRLTLRLSSADLSRSKRMRPMTTTLAAAAAPARVLTDADLFSLIASFQHGLPIALFEVWRDHKPHDAPALQHGGLLTLVELLVQHGTSHLLDLATRASYRMSKTNFLGVSHIAFEPLPLDNVAALALRHNRADLFEWALDNHHGIDALLPQRAWHAAIKQFEDADTRMLEVLKMRFGLISVELLDRLLWVDKLSSSIKHVRLLQWLLDEIPGLEIKPAIVTSAAADGNVPLLAFVYGHGVTTCDSDAFERARRGRHHDALTFLLEHYASNLDPDGALAIALDAEPVVQALAVQSAEKLQAGCHAFMAQADGGTAALAQVQQWHERGLLAVTWPVSIDVLASKSSLGIVRFLHDQHLAVATTEAMDRAAELQKWDLVEFLHAHRSDGCTTRAMDAAIEHDNLKYVQFFHQHRTEGCSPQGLARAAAAPSWFSLRYLHLHDVASFSAATMDAAAAQGNLSVVKFLHAHRREGCTTAAIDQAAVNGHLHVVQFLHTKRSEGCTSLAMEGAIRHGHVAVVRFLFDAYPQLVDHERLRGELVRDVVGTALRTGELALVQLLVERAPALFNRDGDDNDAAKMQDVLLRGALDVYKRLRCHDPFVPDIVGAALFEAGRALDLPTIRLIVETLGRRDIAYRAMDGAANRHGCGVVHVLRAVYAITGPQSCRLSAVRAAIEHDATNEDAIQFLIQTCCEPDALPAAIKIAKRVRARALTKTITQWTSDRRGHEETEEANVAPTPLHSFVLDPRTTKWVLDRLLDCGWVVPDKFRSLRAPCTWAIQAVHERDVSFIDMIAAVKALSSRPQFNHKCRGPAMDDNTMASLVDLEGAREAAIRRGDLAMLQRLLLPDIDVPIEPTLLDEAVFHDQRVIADWLVDHYPEACVALPRVHPTRVMWLDSFGLSVAKLEWLESNDTQRKKLGFRGILEVVQADDVDALRRVHTRYPHQVVTRLGLAEPAKRAADGLVVRFLEEIGYPV